jgi:small conductance mechanosensitive channel
MRQFVDSLLEVSPRLLFPFLQALAIVVLGIWTLKMVDSLLKRIARIVPADESQRARVEHRTETLRHFVRSLGRAVLGIVVILKVAIDLELLDPTEALAGAGIVGLAVGFGAQSLVKDIIAGFFVLLEDQYGVGESVRIGTQEGVVEGMSLRVTILRNADGEVHVIPNGSVQTVTVLSRDWRRALVDIEVSSSEEIGRVFNVLSRIGEGLARDMSGRILDKPAIVGIERMTRAGILIRLAARTHPAQQGEVAHEWRRRIKETFEKEGIRLAEGAAAGV